MAADTAIGRKAKGGTPRTKATSRKPANALSRVALHLIGF